MQTAVYRPPRLDTPERAAMKLRHMLLRNIYLKRILPSIVKNGKGIQKRRRKKI